MAKSVPRARGPRSAAPHNPFPIVGIGASAGGLDAFRRLLAALPSDTGTAYVLVQHLDPRHGSILAHLLSPTTGMPVAEATDDMRVEPDHVYVIPPPHDVTITDGKLKLVPRAKRGGSHMPIDLFLRALAGAQGSLAVGVVLSGAGSDGTLGLKAIKAFGGTTFAQEPTSAGFDGMPGSAIAAGCVDKVLPPEGIARELSRRTHRAGGPSIEDEAGSEQPAAVHEDHRTPVASFFPDPKAFSVLSGKVLPRLFAQKAPDMPVRVWVPGCATGELAYSIAICLLEQADVGRNLEVFATDQSDAALRTARAATYPDTIVQDVSPERLRRFFIRLDGQYKVDKTVRDVCVFARHDLTRDPPFSRMDLIGCRNLLVRLQPDARQDVLAKLHYSLQPHGFLMIGASEPMEATGRFASRYGQGIYARLAPPAKPRYRARPRARVESPARSAARDEKDRRIAQLERELDDSRLHLHSLLQEYDSADEELRTANEEALVANDELRNINEELETAKEHVQSVNEELEMLNEELQDRNRRLGSAADDLMNLLDSLNTPIVMVEADLGLRRFTPSAERLLNLIPSDVGRPLGDLRTNLEAPDLAKTVRGVIDSLVSVDRVVKDREGRAYLLRVRPYLTRERKIDGAVIILTDLAALKAS